MGDKVSSSHSFGSGKLGGSLNQYFDNLCAAMTLLASDDRTIFMGQGVGCEGTTMSATFRNIDACKRLEMPVAEEMQTGMAIGMSLMGLIPVCIFPRWNFMLRATDQIVNHLDRLPLFSGYKPKIIIRTAVPSNKPFNPGPQHDDDFTTAFRQMLRTVDVVTLKKPEDIVKSYDYALHHAKLSTLIVEYTEFYRDQRAEDDARG